MKEMQRTMQKLLGTLVVALTCAECSTPEMAYEPMTGLKASPQMNGRVVLLLTQPLETYRYAPTFAPDGLSLGPALAKYAEDSVKPLFRDLQIVHANAVPANSPPTLVLVPAVMSAYAGVCNMAWCDRPVSITIRWSLQDQNAVELWTTTVQGDAHGHLGNGFTGRDNYLRDFSTAAAAAFRDSNNRIAGSSEIKASLKAVQ